MLVILECHLDVSSKSNLLQDKTKKELIFQVKKRIVDNIHQIRLRVVSWN